MIHKSRVQSWLQFVDMSLYECCSPGDLMVEDFTGPLSPPYPPVQQVTIVRGSAPPLGFRQTNHYTELVLPPGFVDPHYSKR